MRCKFIWLGNVAKDSIKYISVDDRYFSIYEDFIKNDNEESDEEYFREVDIQYLEKLHELHNTFHFNQKE